MKLFKFYIAISIAIIISSCGTIRDGFSNQKKNNSDEFLVEKKSPLVMPPDFDELPLPNDDKQTSEQDEESEIKSLISNNENSTNESQNNSNQNTSFENSILEKIKKN